MKQPVIKTSSIAALYGTDMARFLADKIVEVYPEFPIKQFIAHIKKSIPNQSYSQRLVIFADALHTYLPDDYEQSINILVHILGPENPAQTGMFKQYGWIMPISKYIERYGTEHFTISMKAISEITKRCTGEFAVRVFITTYPDRALRIMKKWARSKNFHLRRLASEGLRPRLPWASKLDIFYDQPEQVFEILELLKADEILFVKKSVANHLRDWIKVRPDAGRTLVKNWNQGSNPHTRWILKHALRKGL